MSILETAYEYEALGFAPVPCNVTKTSCEVIARWQNDFQKVDGWRHYFEKQTGIGIKLGKASGHLIVVDVDQKHDSTATISGRFLEAMKYLLPEIHDNFYVEETRSGGLHIFFRMAISPSKVVPAKTMDMNKAGELAEFALIEILGEGQMVFTHPTNGYRIIQGSIEEIPVLTDKDYFDLLSICKSFNEIPVAVEPEVQAYPSEMTGDETRPGDIFNRRCDPHKFANFMVGKGWAVHHKIGDKYWLTRPGKDKGVSATWNHDGRKLLCVFSSNSEFETSKLVENERGERVEKHKGHTPFSVFARLQCNGDFKEATRILVEKGFVNPDEWEDVEPLEPIKAKPFDLDAILPLGCESFKKYVKEVANSYQVQPEMVLLPAVSAVSLAICSCARIQINNDWKEDAPIWSIVVAEASERKSPVLKEVMQPFDDYFKDFGKKHKSAIKALVRRRAGIVGKIAALEEKYQKAIIKNEAIEPIERDLASAELELSSIPEIVDLPNLLQSDATPEALVKQLKRNGEVCGVISAEADPIEVVLGLYSDKPNFSIYLKGFSVERYNHNRVGGGETVLEQPRIVLSVMMQREPMEKLANSRVARSRGFIGRVFYAVPTSLVGNRVLEPDPISEESREWWSDRLKSILALPHRLRLYESAGNLSFYDKDPFIIKMSDEARAIFLEARKINERELITGGEYDDEGGWGGKIMGNICRLALSLHFLSGRGLRDEVGPDTMKSAIAWIPHLTEHYYCATGEVGEITTDKIIHSTIRKMMTKGIKSGVRVRDVYDAVRNNRMQKSDDWTPIWERMKNLGFIRIKDGEKPSKGATPKVMELHPNFYGLAK